MRKKNTPRQEMADKKSAKYIYDIDKTTGEKIVKNETHAHSILRTAHCHTHTLTW